MLSTTFTFTVNLIWAGQHRHNLCYHWKTKCKNMKKIFTLIFILTAVMAAAQPVDETILTKNFTDPYDIKKSDLDNNSFEDIVVCGVGGISWFSNTNGSDFEVINIMDTATVFDLE